MFTNTIDKNNDNNNDKKTNKKVLLNHVITELIYKYDFGTVPVRTRVYVCTIMCVFMNCNQTKQT